MGARVPADIIPPKGPVLHELDLDLIESIIAEVSIPEDGKDSYRQFVEAQIPHPPQRPHQT
jgi:pyridoxal biosynthesis lyase PdxS